MKDLIFTNKNIGLLLQAVVASSIALTLPACSKSRRSERAGTPSSPQRVYGGNEPQHQNVPRKPHKPGENHTEQPPVETDFPRERTPLNPGQPNRAQKPNTPPSLDGLRKVNVKGAIKKETHLSGTQKGSKIGCSSSHCQEKKPEPPTKENGPSQEPIKSEPITQKPNQEEIPETVNQGPQEQTNKTPPPIASEQEKPSAQPMHLLDNPLQSESHFHFLLVVDPRTLAISLENGTRKERVSQIAKDFLNGFAKKRAELEQLNNESSHLHFTFGLVAGTTDQHHAGEFFHDFVKDYDLTSQGITQLESDLINKLKLLSNESTAGTNSYKIPGGHNYSSLQKFIENNPHSVDPSKEFLAKNVPTVVLSLYNKKDQCELDAYTVNSDGSENKSSSCIPNVGYIQQLRDLIDTKIDLESGSEYVSPVSYKHILLKANRELMTKNSLNNTGDTKYYPHHHGKIFAHRLNQRKQFHRIDHLQFQDLTKVGLVNIYNRPEERCYISKDSNVMFTTLPQAQYALQKTTNSQTKTCQLIDDGQMTEQVLIRLQKEDLKSLDSSPITHPVK